jgi:hypothetical protein
LDLLRWGLVPHWAKDINVGFANINAKAEGIESKPAFRDAFRRRRCLARCSAEQQLLSARLRTSPKRVSSIPTSCRARSIASTIAPKVRIMSRIPAMLR